MIAPDMVPSVLGFLECRSFSWGPIGIVNAPEPYNYGAFWVMNSISISLKLWFLQFLQWDVEGCKRARLFVPLQSPRGALQSSNLSFAPEMLRPNTWGPATGLYRQRWVSSISGLCAEKNEGWNKEPQLRQDPSHGNCECLECLRVAAWSCRYDMCVWYVCNTT